MSYEVNIYHLNIDVGDSTLIIVTQGNVVMSTVLIDGGKSSPRLQGLLDKLYTKFKFQLSAVIVTHYDADHLLGIVELLEQLANKDPEISRYFSTSIRTRLYDVGYYRSTTSDESTKLYRRYLQAVGNK